MDVLAEGSFSYKVQSAAESTVPRPAYAQKYKSFNLCCNTTFHCTAQSQKCMPLCLVWMSLTKFHKLLINEINQMLLPLMLYFKIQFLRGNCCCSVGIAVASYSRGPRFKSSQRHILNRTFVYLLSTVLKRRKINKRGQEWPGFFKKRTFLLSFIRFQKGNVLI